jgi:hypothetical protein
MNIIFMSVLAVLVLVAQPTLAMDGPNDPGINEGPMQSDGMRNAVAALNKGEFQNAYDLLYKEQGEEKDGKFTKNPNLTKDQKADIHYLMGVSLIGRDGTGQDLVLEDTSENLDQNAYVRHMHDRPTNTHLTRALANKPNHEGALFELGMLEVFHDNSKSFYGDKTFKVSSDLLARLDKLCSFNCGLRDELKKALEAAKATTPYAGNQIATAPPSVMANPMATKSKGLKLIEQAQARFKTEKRPQLPGLLFREGLRKSNKAAKSQ